MATDSSISDSSTSPMGVPLGSVVVFEVYLDPVLEVMPIYMVIGLPMLKAGCPQSQNDQVRGILGHFIDPIAPLQRNFGTLLVPFQPPHNLPRKFGRAVPHAAVSEIWLKY